MATWAREAVEAAGLVATDDLGRRLELLLGLWRHYGRAINLTGDVDGEKLRAHVQEALVAVEVAQRASPNSRWADIGSGGGFPGLVMASALRERGVLVEPRERRAAFLELALWEIGRGDIPVYRGRVGNAKEVAWVEKLERFVGGQVGIAGARAVFEVEQWLVIGREMVGDHGVVLVHARYDWSPPYGWVEVARGQHLEWGVFAVRWSGNTDSAR